MLSFNSKKEGSPTQPTLGVPTIKDFFTYFIKSKKSSAADPVKSPDKTTSGWFNFKESGTLLVSQVSDLDIKKWICTKKALRISVYHGK